MKRVQAVLLAALAGAVSIAGCDDPVPGPVGGVVLVIRTFEAEPPSRFAEVERIVVEYDRIEGVVSTLSGTSHVTLNTERRELVLVNEDTDVFVAQLQVPVGELEQLRIFPARVVLQTRAAGTFELGPDGPELPSWSNTGWKIVPEDGVPFTIVENELTGIRGLLDFDDRLVRNGPRTEPAHRWKIKPTLPAESFDPNPTDAKPGVYLDQLVVVFERGTSRTRVDDINTAIGATILREPVLSTGYRIKLPATQTLETASDHYTAQSEVLAVTPVINMALRQVTPAEGTQATQDLVRLPFAWETAQTRGGGNIGSHQVRVAVIDTGIDVTHPDVRLNIGINQGELPESLFGDPRDIAAHDCDPPGAPDGIISMRDLECDAMIRPPDSNGNMLVDAVDILNDDTDCSTGCWMDDVDDDNFDIATDMMGETFVDDVVGWNFEDGTPFAIPLDNDVHGTYLAGIVGAEGDATGGIAGASWRVSITPLVIGERREQFHPSMPNLQFLEAVYYIQQIPSEFHVALYAGGWTFWRDDTDSQCGTTVDTTKQVPNEVFFDGQINLTDFFLQVATETSRRLLWVLAAPNNSSDIDRFEVFDWPYESMNSFDVFRDGLVYVGASLDGTNIAPFSAYASGSVEVGRMVYAPGVNWTSLLRRDEVCSVTVGVDRPRTCDQRTCPPGGDLLPECTLDACPLEGNTEVCVATGTSFAAATVAGSAALLLADTSRLRTDAIVLADALVGAAPTLADYAICRGDTFTGGLLDADRLLTDNAP